MRRPIFAIVSTFCLMMSLACCAGELDSIISSGVLRVAVKNTERSPFVHRNRAGKYYGFELDFAERCARLLKVGMRIVVCETSEEMIDSVADGKADIALGLLSRTPERILKVNFTNPYVKLRMSFLVHRMKLAGKDKDKQLVNYLRAYSGAIHVLEATSHEKLARQLFTNATIKPCTQGELHQLWESKRLLAFFSDQLTVRKMLARQPGSRVFYQQINFDDVLDYICIAVPVDCPRLLYWLNCELESCEPYIAALLKDAL